MIKRGQNKIMGNKLTKTERLILMNQSAILAALLQTAVNETLQEMLRTQYRETGNAIKAGDK